MVEIEATQEENNNFMPIKFFLAVFFMAFISTILFFPDISFASSTVTSLPWETPLTKVADSFKGPVAFSISLLGIIGAGATLVWGGEINEFLRTMIKLVLAISLIAFVASILSELFGLTH